jgi:DNA repair protein SbcC/Rad50
MKIDRLIVDGFGKLHNQQIRFAPDRVNLLVEENEFGKSTIAEAIFAVLYGFGSGRTTQEKLAGIEAKRPLSGGPYKVAFEISVQGHRYRVTRDFENEDAQIVDLESGIDVTAEFFPKKGRSQIGEKLIKLSREQFQQTCFIGHHSLIHNDPDLKRNFEQIASSSQESNTAAQAIAALQKGLDQLPGATMGGTLKVETEIRRLEGKITETKATLSVLEDNKRRHEPDVTKLTILQGKIDTRRKDKAELERLQLAAYAQDLNARVSEQEQLLKDIGRLSAERDELTSFEAFPAAINENIVRWHGQRNTKATELQNTKEDIANTQQELEKLISQIDTRFSRLATFTASDRDKLVAARERLSSVVSPLVEVARLREAELESLKNLGVIPARFNDLDSMLAALDSSTREAAIGYPQRHEEQLAELARNERSAKEQSQSIERIDAERKRRKNRALYLLIVCATATGVFGILFLSIPDLKLLWGTLSATSLALAVLLLVIVQRAYILRADDRSEATLNLQRATLDAGASRVSLQDLDRKWNSVAKSVAIGSARELAGACLEHLRMGEDLRELRRLTIELNLLREQKHGVQDEVFPFLQRAGRPPSLKTEVSQQMIDQVLSELEAYFGLCGQIEVIKDRLTRLEAGQQRIKEDADALDNRLRNGFQEGGIKVEDSAFDKAYDLFRERLEKHQRFRKLDSEELPRLEKTKMPVEQLLELMNEQENVHEKLLERGVAELVQTRTHGQYADELARVNYDQEHLTEELATIRLAISKALGNYETESGSLLERADELEARLARVTSYRDAVSFALDKLQVIASDVHREWSESLNAICEEMLPAIKSNYRSIRFADDLSFTVETADSGTLFTMRDITSRLSLGAREQLFLLQRLAVSQFLSNASVKLPLILDDPLVTSDDDRFLQLMRFVIEVLPKEHQVLIFSCHKRRHEWLREQLGDLFHERVHLVQLEPIETGGVSLNSEVISHVN